MSLETGTPNEPTADAVSDPGTAPEATAPAAVAQPERTYTRKDVDAAYSKARRYMKTREQEIRQDFEARQQRNPAARRAAAERRLARPRPSVDAGARRERAAP